MRLRGRFIANPSIHNYTSLQFHPTESNNACVGYKYIFWLSITWKQCFMYVARLKFWEVQMLHNVVQRE